MRRRSFVVATLAVVLAGSSGAAAAAVRPFDGAAFAAVQQAGKPIVVVVHASW